MSSRPASAGAKQPARKGHSRNSPQKQRLNLHPDSQIQAGQLPPFHIMIAQLFVRLQPWPVAGPANEPTQQQLSHFTVMHYHKNVSVDQSQIWQSQTLEMFARSKAAAHLEDCRGCCLAIEFSEWNLDLYLARNALPIIYRNLQPCLAMSPDKEIGIRQTAYYLFLCRVQNPSKGSDA